MFANSCGDCTQPNDGQNDEWSRCNAAGFSTSQQKLNSSFAACSTKNKTFL
jgi:hypothetical protein